jgi:hypothetical protein
VTVIQKSQTDGKIVKQEIKENQCCKRVYSIFELMCDARPLPQMEKIKV